MTLHSHRHKTLLGVYGDLELSHGSPGGAGHSHLPAAAHAITQQQ